MEMPTESAAGKCFVARRETIWIAVTGRGVKPEGGLVVLETHERKNAGSGGPALVTVRRMDLLPFVHMSTTGEGGQGVGVYSGWVRSQVTVSATPCSKENFGWPRRV
jgi:hypothetical protein